MMTPFGSSCDSGILVISSLLLVRVFPRGFPPHSGSDSGVLGDLVLTSPVMSTMTSREMTLVVILLEDSDIVTALTWGQ
jgi:hypothetical protein